MENKPNYYAIIPANVRYDRELSSTAKLLYAEITALCNQKGYCWANNSYFEELYFISDRQVRNILQLLKIKNYISIDLIDNKIRKISIVCNPEKNFLPPGKKFPPNPEKNFLHNNKMNNKKNKRNKRNENLPSWIYEEVRSEIMTAEELAEFEKELI